MRDNNLMQKDVIGIFLLGIECFRLQFFFFSKRGYATKNYDNLIFRMMILSLYSIFELIVSKQPEKRQMTFAKHIVHFSQVSVFLDICRSSYGCKILNFRCHVIFQNFHTLLMLLYNHVLLR